MINPALELQGSYYNTAANSNFDWCYGGGSHAWDSVEIAVSKIPQNKRHGTTIGVLIGGVVKEFWWPDATKLADTDLVAKIAEALDVYTKDQTYNKTEVDDRFSNIQQPTRETLGINKTDNTADIDKPVSNPTKLELEKKVDKETLLESFPQTLYIQYVGVNTFSLSFAPKGPGVAVLNGWPYDPDADDKFLDPFSEYRFENDKIILAAGILKPGINYTLKLTYFK